MVQTVHRTHRPQRIARGATTLGVIALLATGSWLIAGNVGKARPSHPAAPVTTASGVKIAVPNEAPPNTDPAELAAEQRLDPIAQQLTAIGTQDAALENVWIAPPRLLIQIYRTTAASSVSESTYSAAVPAGIEIEFLPALLSAGQEHQLDTLVESRRQWLADNGITLSQYGGNGRGGPYHVGYSEQTPPDNSLLQPFQIFGADTVVFENLPAPGYIP